MKKELTISDPETPPENSRPPKPSYSKTPNDLELMLIDLGVALRYNLRAHRTEWKLGKADDWTPSNDRLEQSIIAMIERHFQSARPSAQASQEGTGLRFGRELWFHCVSTLLANREVDPFLDWLNDLPEWDGMKYLDVVLDLAFKVSPGQDQKLVHWVSRFPFMGAVARSLSPGLKLDETPVLIGDQGIGKSMFLSHLLPPQIRDDGFSDQLSLNADAKVRAEAIQGRVLVEIAEMSGSNRAELESLKAFMTRQDDGGVRLAYRRNPEPMRRRCVFIGSTNRDQPLPNDPSGNRRWVAVKLESGDPEEIIRLLDEMRPKLWAEALARVKGGEQVWLDRSLKAAQTTANESARASDPLIEEALELLDTSRSYTLSEIMTECGLSDAGKNDRRLERRVSAAIRNMGWSSRVRTIRGTSQRRWECTEKLH